MYKTQYASALTANNLTKEDLYPKTQIQLEEVVSVENSLKEARESLQDADPDEIAGINESIANIESLLSTLDVSIVKRINGHNMLKEKMDKAQAARKPKGSKTDNKKAGGDIGEEKTITPVVKMEEKTSPAITDTKTKTAAQTTLGTNQPKPKPEEKKSTNWGAIIFGGLVTLGLAAYGITASKKGLWPFKKNN